MAVTIQCPRCKNKQKISDDKLGSEVTCKVCMHEIETGQSKAKSADADGARIQSATPVAATAKVKTEDDRPRSRRRARDDDDHDDTDDDRGRRRRAASGGSGSSLMWIFGIIGGVLLLMVVCGGGVIGFFFYIGRQAGEALAEEGRRMEEEHRRFQQEFRNNPGFPNNNPFQQEVIDPNDPGKIDRVITLLKGAEPERGPAYAWLKAANVNHPRRAEVAKILDEQVDNYLVRPAPLGNGPLFDAFFKWASKDNVPCLVNVVDKTPFTVWDNEYRQRAMKMLGAFKDARGAEPLAKKLGNAFDGKVASSALTDMGAVAEPAVLKYFNHQDTHARNEARRLIQSYKTSNNAIITQCIGDLDAADNNRRNPALQWLSTAPADAKRRADVSRALNKSIANANFFIERDLQKALETWGTSENVPTLVQRLEAAKTGDGVAIQVLAKIRDPNGMKAIAKAMGNFFNEGEAKKALRDYGPPAEPIVIEAMNAATDQRGRKVYVNFLGEIGTRNVSLAALQQLAVRNPQDRFLLNDIAAAQKAIIARGK